MTWAELSPREAIERLSELVVIDVRGEDEFEGRLGHVEGAKLVPLPDLEARIAELPRSRALLIVCRSGARSAKACALLEAHGFASLANLVGGMLAWNDEGLPVMAGTSP